MANELGGLALQLTSPPRIAGNRIADAAKQRFGKLDIVVHNAGITRDKMLANMDEAKWGSVIAVNIEAQLTMNEQLLAHEAFQNSPRIATMSSTSGIAGNRGRPTTPPRRRDRHGQLPPTAWPTRRQHQRRRPGFIETDMTASIPFVNRQVARRVNSLQQGGQPGDVAQAISFLVSDRALGVNGEVLRVCGQNIVGQ